MSYRFHVDEKTGDLLSDHFGGPVSEDPAIPGTTPPNGWSTRSHLRREFPDLGKGDFRNPSVFIKHHEGFTVSHFRYVSYEVMDGKPELPELPATFGSPEKVKSLVVRLYDSHSQVAADLMYSIFPEHDAITRRVVLTNESERPVTIEKLGSMSIDFPYAEYDVIGLRGEWSRERSQFRRKVDYGMQRSARFPRAMSQANSTTVLVATRDTLRTSTTPSWVSLLQTPQNRRAMLGVSPSFIRALLRLKLRRALTVSFVLP